MGGATGHMKSRGLMAWLFAFQTSGQAKSQDEAITLAWPILAWLGPAHSLRPGQAYH
jgi:hypothetical protein